MSFSSKHWTIIRNFGLAAFLIAIMILSTQTIGLSRSGFDFATGPSGQSLTGLALLQYIFYIGPAVGFLLGIIVLLVVELTINDDDKKYGDSLAFNSPGELPGVPLDFFKNSFKLFFLSLIVFNGLGLYGAITHQTFTGVGVLQHQFSPTDNLIYSGVLIPAAENLGAAFVIAFIIFGVRALARKTDMNPFLFAIICMLLATFLVGGYGYLNHLLRYGASDVALQSVFIFWAVGGFISVLTGSFIPFWVMHFDNNLFFSLSQNFSNDNILFGTLIVEVVLILLFVVTFVLRKQHVSE